MTKTILVVEDKSSQSSYLKSVLESQQYYVVVANSSADVESYLEEKTPDLVLGDTLGGDISGFDLCQQIKSNPRTSNIPVMLLSALTEEQDLIMGLEAGIDGFIAKPYSGDKVIDSIEQIFNYIQNKKNLSDKNKFLFNGKMYDLHLNKSQLINLLQFTFKNTIDKNNQLISANLSISQMKEEIEQLNKSLKETNEENSKFIGIAAHDIRNPIGTIFNCAELLDQDLKETLTTSQSEMFDFIKQSTKSLLKLLKDLLEVSKLENGGLELNYEKQNFVEFMKSTVFNNSYLADKKSIKIIEEFLVDEIEVNFDEFRLEQVINNLLSNAIKFSKPNSTITVNISKTADTVKVFVKDEAMGIDKKIMPILFKPFAKIKKESSDETGSGLGLFTCKKIIEAHKGKIWAISQVGVGSSFIFELPLNTVLNKEETKADPFEYSCKILGDKKILVVDDNDINYAFFNATLGQYGVSLDRVNNGKKAVDICSEKDYDLILMDIHMPVLNGLEATREIRKFNTKVKILSQTAYVYDGMREKCLQAGCDDYLPMPIRPSEVVYALVRLLANS